MKDANILLQLGDFKVYTAQLVSIGLIIFLTYINTRGIKGGKMIQTIFTVVKLLSLFGLIVFGFLLAAKADIWNANWADAWHMTTRNADGAIISGVTGSAILGAIAASMVGSIFSSDAWNNVTFIAGEIKNPKRNIGLSLFLGTLIVTVIYVSANLMYVSVMPLNKIASAPQDRVAVAASKVVFGDIGTYVIAIMIMISTFGCNNGLILAGARVYNAMAVDKLFFPKAAVLNRYAVPEYALWAQCIMAAALCLSGKYGDLLDMISFVVVLFYALTILGIFRLRSMKPDMERPYRAFGYPVLPGIYILLAIVFCVFLIIMKPLYAGIGLGIVLLGIPVYYVAIASQRNNNAKF
jgi:APA family basic amino acid/polyamine antiporter